VDSCLWDVLMLVRKVMFVRNVREIMNLVNQNVR